jgi:hypothetical protein
MRQLSGNKREKSAREVNRTTEDPSCVTAARPVSEKTHLRYRLLLYPNLLGLETNKSQYVGVGRAQLVSNGRLCPTLYSNFRVPFH